MITGSIVRADTISIWLAEAEEQIKAQSDYLTQLDAAIGDGDHGTNMRRGFDAVGKALAGQGDDLPPGRLLIVAGKTLVATVGGASGPCGARPCGGPAALSDQRTRSMPSSWRWPWTPPSRAWSSLAPRLPGTRR